MPVQEIEEAETLLFKWIQHDGFGTDFLAVTQNQPLSKKRKLLRLTPFLDERGMMKIGGRLSKGALTETLVRFHRYLVVLLWY